MTEKYDPYQNAVAERINGILKQEFLVGIQPIQFSNFDLMTVLLKESIKTYNEQRPHFSNFMLTPKQMHQQAKVKMRTYKKQKTEYQNGLVLS